MPTIEFLENVWNAYLAPFGGVVVFVAVLAILAKKLFDHYFEKAMGAHRLELDREKEQFSDELKQIAFVYQIKFSALHAQQAEFIKKLHGLLIQAKRFLDKMNTGPIESQDETYKAFFAAVRDAQSELEEGCIYLTKPLADSIQDLLWRFHNLSDTYTTAYVVLRQGGQEAVDFRRVLMEDRRGMNKAVGELQNEFRALLGASLPLPRAADK